jgi:lipopolysaccharide/colanic/teichoic acid biosynthesis glycosyltransferase
MSENERMLDNEYADQFKGDNYSFWYDVKLILRTIPALLKKGPFNIDYHKNNMKNLLKKS